MVSARGVTIRPAGPADAGELAKLRHAFRIAIDPATEDDDAFLRRCGPWMEERLADPSTGWRAWVAETGAVAGAEASTARLVGHVWLRRLEKIPNPVGEVEAHAYLTNMYVEPGLRGAGVGSRLLEAALAWCREQRFGSVVLWPTERSRTLYGRAGFRDTGDVLELPLNPAHCGRAGVR
ncbi:MAG: GNAT family N-acetyltransferase [Candidatus Palauibacterales bacterium]|nr:GNAT family N-acetyltransferase [Candidatus Palauibacterales bacterium]MDP2530814.1 GNAT family N-acetyltransferase [Candidatus Palauibacterales bacterium]MDP2583112.1 GNAT family N-acetyltransferase [Candidatus Palauibacterales bacterium]